jgi:hypothetical protein
VFTLLLRLIRGVEWAVSLNAIIFHHIHNKTMHVQCSVTSLQYSPHVTLAVLCSILKTCSQRNTNMVYLFTTFWSILNWPHALWAFMWQQWGGFMFSQQSYNNLKMSIILLLSKILSFDWTSKFWIAFITCMEEKY